MYNYCFFIGTSFAPFFAEKQTIQKRIFYVVKCSETKLYSQHTFIIVLKFWDHLSQLNLVLFVYWKVVIYCTLLWKGKPIQNPHSNNFRILETKRCYGSLKCTSCPLLLLYSVFISHCKCLYMEGWGIPILLQHVAESFLPDFSEPCLSITFSPWRLCVPLRTSQFKPNVKIGKSNSKLCVKSIFAFYTQTFNSVAEVTSLTAAYFRYLQS
jgi:hypothetical protein